MVPSANVIPVNDENFDEEVLRADIPVLVDFTGRWCPPCRALEPIVERVAAETRGRVKVVSVDADDSPGLARRYGVRGVPTLLVFRHGEKTRAHLGLTTRERLLELLEVELPLALREA
jgi:thioredoxin 1